jgi:hypothetical protein
LAVDSEIAGPQDGIEQRHGSGKTEPQPQRLGAEQFADDDHIDEYRRWPEGQIKRQAAVCPSSQLLHKRCVIFHLQREKTDRTAGKLLAHVLLFCADEVVN